MYTVLLIEDQFDVASMLRLALSRAGYRALLASNLAEAQKIWSAFKAEIDLVMTDNALPDGSGISFAEVLARERSSLKVLVSSGLPPENLPRAFRQIEKPFNISALLDILQDILPPVPSG